MTSLRMSYHRSELQQHSITHRVPSLIVPGGFFPPNAHRTRPLRILCRTNNEVRQFQGSRRAELRSSRRLQLSKCLFVFVYGARTGAIGWNVNIEAAHVRIMRRGGDATV